MKLSDTSAGAVQRAITAERMSAGAVATGLVLTLVLLTDERSVEEVSAAAEQAALSHPCRQLAVLLSEPDGSVARLDADVEVGGRHGPGESVTLRMSGRVALHPDSVVLPLLAPDTPVVCYWHGEPPQRTASDDVGALASRRITDVALAGDPLAALAIRSREYVPGDTDLAWTRLTGWRSVLAAGMDTWVGPVLAAEVTCAPGNASGWLLASWLRARLGLEVTVRHSRGPGLTGVRLRGTHDGTPDGEPCELVLERLDGLRCSVRRSGQPERTLPIPRRDLSDLLAEELRRLGEDLTYAEALRSFEVVRRRALTNAR